MPFKHSVRKQPSRLPSRLEQPAGRRIARQPAPWTLTLSSPAATRRVGSILASQLAGGEILALQGDLGAGKTLLVRGVAEGLGASQEQIASPTFVLIHEYRGRLPLAHVDLYRIERAEELEHLGWSDYLDGQWVVAVEWAERAGRTLPSDRLTLRLEHRGPRARELTCIPSGPVAEALVQRLRGALRAVRPQGALRKRPSRSPASPHRPGRKRPQ